MATTPIKESAKLKILKTVFNFTIFLVVIGVIVGVSYYNESKINEVLAANGVNDFADLSENLQQIYGGFEKYVWHTSINSSVLMPIIFVAFAGFMVFKDQLALYYKLPKGVGAAIVILALAFVIEYFAVYAKLSAGAYLVATLSNALYFDPAIAKAIKQEGEANG